jgi:hypothetical protein
VEDIPRGLAALIEKSWERIAGVVDGLGILCAAHEALTLDELGAVAGWTGEAQRRTFVRAARELLVETLRPGGSDGAWITKHTKDEDKPSGATSMPMHLLAPRSLRDKRRVGILGRFKCHLLH